MRFLIVIFCCISFSLFAQTSSEANVILNSTKPLKWDTTYYKKYNERFIVAVYQSQRRYEIEIDPKNPQDSGKASHHYFADANKVTGIEVDFDKVSLSFGFKSVPPENVTLKGKTSYTNFGLSFGGNKWFVENSYRRFKGFYDVNTANYDTSYKEGKPYFQNPSMINESVKTKFFYFTNNKRFAYKSAYTCVYRQMKSSASWVLTSNLYYNSLRTDSSFASPLTRKFYGSDAELKGTRMLGLSAGGGASFNLVIWKAVYFNMTGIANIESQWRKNSWSNGRTNNVQYITGSLDFRVALGINNKNFFMTLSSLNDINVYSSGQLDITSKFYSGNFTIGYRFKVKPPTWYKKIQASKIYNMF